jgi:hypothetical protein
MAAIQIPDELAEQIEQAAQRAGETRDVAKRFTPVWMTWKTSRMAAERLKNPGKRLTLEPVKRDLGLDD